MRYSILSLLSLNLFFGCVHDDPYPPSPDLVDDKGILEIRLDSLNGNILNEIKLVSNDGIYQKINLDSSLKITSIENFISVDKVGEYQNTWMNFDKQGNFMFENSHYYSTYVQEINDSLFIQCNLVAPILKGEKFVIIGDFNASFNELSKNQEVIDFANDLSVFVPIKEPKKGLNKIRFIIVETEKIGEVRSIRKTYVDKDFWLLSDSVPSPKN